MRIPFEEAIGEPRLLKTRIDSMSLPQQTALKALYGLPLSRVEGPQGWSELDYWQAFQGGAVTDELGRLVSVQAGVPYVPQVYKEGWVIAGRRSGKTDSWAATIVAYEATLGGHERYVRKGQPAICFLISQDLRAARYALHFVKAVLESSPLLRQEIVQITAERIELRNGNVIACVPPTLKSVRGFSSPVAVLDEVGVWRQLADSANPDFEVLRAVSPGQMQFPDRKIVGISSPWNKDGLLWAYYEAGTNGRKLPSKVAQGQYEGVLVLHGTTALFDNPLVTESYLQRELQRDPQAFERECLAQFQDSISGFLPPQLVTEAVQVGLEERPPKRGQFYVAALDPAFRRDAFAFTICHNDGGIIVQDVVRRFVGSTVEPLNPAAVLEVLVPLCRAYGVSLVFTDQYHLESFGQLARERGLELQGITFTAKSKAQMYGNLQQLFLQRRIRILQDPETIRELKSLERILTQQGQVHIGAPAGLHDDMATVLCVAAHQVMPFAQAAGRAAPEPEREPSIHERCQAQVAARWAQTMPVGSWD